MSIRRVIFTSGQNLKPPFLCQYFLRLRFHLDHYFNWNWNLKKIVDLKVYCNLKWCLADTTIAHLNNFSLITVQNVGINLKQDAYLHELGLLFWHIQQWTSEFWHWWNVSCLLLSVLRLANLSVKKLQNYCLRVKLWMGTSFLNFSDVIRQKCYHGGLEKRTKQKTEQSALQAVNIIYCVAVFGTKTN